VRPGDLDLERPLRPLSSGRSDMGWNWRGSYDLQDSQCLNAMALSAWKRQSRVDRIELVLVVLQTLRHCADTFVEQT
jgi:hypothetical protein